MADSTAGKLFDESQPGPPSKRKGGRPRKNPDTPPPAESNGNGKPVAPDPHNIDQWRTPPEFVQVKRNVLKVRAAPRPPRDKFFRVMPFDLTHGAEVNCRNMLLFEYEFEGEMTPDSFVVLPNSEPYELLHDKLRPALIVLAVTRGGSQFFWELKYPAGDRRSDGWADTRLKIAQVAQNVWVKPVADMGAGGYNFISPKVDLPDPDWSTVNFDELFDIAYRERKITSSDHPAVKEAIGL